MRLLKDGEAVPSDLSWKRTGRVRSWCADREVVVDNGKVGAGQHDGRDCLVFRGTSIGWKSGTADVCYIKFNKDNCKTLHLGPDGFWQRWLGAHLH